MNAAGNAPLTHYILIHIGKTKIGIHLKQTIGHDGEGHFWTLAQLRKSLLDLPHAPKEVEFVMAMDRDELRRVDLKNFYEVIQECLPAVPNIQVTGWKTDRELSRLLLHLPQQTESLFLDHEVKDGWAGYTVWTASMHQLGESFPKLQVLKIREPSGICYHCHHTRQFEGKAFCNLAESMGLMASTLRKVEFLGLACCTRDNLEPVVQAIRNNCHLEYVWLGLNSAGWNSGPKAALSLDNETKEIIQYGPIIAKSKKKLEKKRDPNTGKMRLKDFVETLVDLRDRPDCLAFFLRPSEYGIDPSLYAEAALEGLKKRKAQEKTGEGLPPKEEKNGNRILSMGK